MPPSSESTPAPKLRLPIKVQRLHPAAILPTYATALAAGADLCCIEAFTLEPGARQLIPTGLAIEILPGWYGRVAPRSGLAVKHGIDVLAGVIDADYRGELRVLLINLGEQTVSFEVGARIAQLIIEQAAQGDYLWVEELNDTARGAGGFGSTDR